MSNWERAISLYLNVDAVGAPNALLAGTTSDARSDVPSFIQGDVLPLRLYFRRPVQTLGGASAAVPLDPGDTIVVAGRPTASLAAGPTLFSSSGFSAAGTGDTAHYTATLNLNTMEIASSFGSGDSMDVTVDVEVMDDSGAVRATLRFPARILRQVYDGTAGGGGTPLPNGFFFFRNEQGADCLRIVNRDGQTLFTLEPPQ